MNLYDLISGVVFIAGGCYAFLVGSGRLQISPNNPEKSQQWRKKHGRLITWAGSAIVIYGVFRLLTFL